MWKLLGISLVPALVSALSFDAATIHKDAAPILSSMNAKTVPDTYMVLLKKHVTKENADVHHAWVQDLHLASMRSQAPLGSDPFSGVKHTYNLGDRLFGYAGHFDEATIEQIRRHPEVELVERDSVVSINLPTAIPKDENELKSSKLEDGAPWGLARISHRDELRLGDFNKYLYASEGGEGVDVYVIDTGTFVGHADFEGRAEWTKTIPVDSTDEDGNGHGTHCSGTIAGKKYGVAKKAHIKAIKVLGDNGSGSMSDVVKGVERAVQEHEENVKAAKKGFKGSAANMSLGGGKSVLLDRAVNAAVDHGIHFAVAAGNDNADSCNYSPAAAENAVTVGASSLVDERAYFSNYGPCNDIFGPGLDIESTWIGSEHAINTISGTSMASPHIAGLLAYMLSLQPSKDSGYAVEEITPKKLKAALIAVATRGALDDVPADTANLLAWNGGGKSNFSAIVEEGGYEVKKHARVHHIDFEQELEALDHAFEDVLEDAKSKGNHAWEEAKEEFNEDLEDLKNDYKKAKSEAANVWEESKEDFEKELKDLKAELIKAKSEGNKVWKESREDFEEDLEELKEEFENAKSQGAKAWKESKEDLEEELEELKEEFQDARDEGKEFLEKTKHNLDNLFSEVAHKAEDFVDEQKAAIDEL